MAYFDFEEQKPIVIDNGGHTIKAGWSAEDAPLVVFDNIYGRPRKDLRKVDHRPQYVLSYSFFLLFPQDLEHLLPTNSLPLSSFHLFFSLVVRLLNQFTLVKRHKKIGVSWPYVVPCIMERSAI